MKTFWKENVVYQIYPRSFCDSNGDGIGDIQGIISKLDILKDLGVDILWLSPVYQSPNRDFGYDVSDYLEINPEYGTMEDMDALLLECQKKGLKIIMDLVINHTSDEHPWFIKSKQNDPIYRDYYIWRDQPSNWSGFFSGTTWEKYEDAYYLHLFLKEQPDLNWKNPKVLEETKEIMHFWLKKGVSGFRLDVINIIYKTSLENGKKHIALTGKEHYHSQEGCHEILKTLRQEVMNKYEAFTVGETVLVTVDQANELIHPSRKELDMVFSFEHMEVDQINNKWFKTKFKPQKLIDTLIKWQVGAYWNANYLENHDQPRSVSRFGNDKAYHYESATALIAMLLTLKGTPFIYQGQEIGMKNGEFKTMEDYKDPETHRIESLMRKLHFPKGLRKHLIHKTSRDHARMPIPWTRQGGFSISKPWIQMNTRMKEINVQSQMEDQTSIWHQTRTLISLRKSYSSFSYGSFNVRYHQHGVFVYERILNDEKIEIIINLTGMYKKLNKMIDGNIIWSNQPLDIKMKKIKPYHAIIVKN
ncbi:MAG: alpha-glucosidase [Acholeplasmataceae bacterium]|nr:alpha-glucosidase [Acholeplasmataceae bacterium]